MNLLQQVSTICSQALQDAFPEIKDTHAQFVEVSQSTQPQFGHYQCNSAMKLAKVLQKPPRVIANEIVAKLQSPFISKIEIAGPGFINITLDEKFLEKSSNQILNDPRLGVNRTTPAQNIIIDFSSPNTAKEMHVGHLRSTIIGDCLARVLEFQGNNVLRLNHIGDWGTAFGMLIAFLKRNHPNVLTGEENTDLTHLVGWYKESKALFDNDPAFKLTSQQEVVKLQSGDAEAKKAWEIICEISRKAYQEIYDLLNIKLQERGESFYNPQLAGIVAELEAKGLVEISDGAKCIFLEGFKNREGDALPLMVQKSDGGFNYDTTDMAAIKQRVQEEKGDRLIYVTDAGQATHFDMIFKAAEKAGYVDPSKVKTEHVPFGLVLGEDGKKFKTRSGTTERLMDLLDNAIIEAEKILREKNPGLSEEEIKHIAHVLGISAVKYADLSCHRTSNYVFSYERMLRFDGNTAAFLMYSYVRAEGIKRRTGANIDELKRAATITLTHPSEVTLALHLLRFEETLDSVSADLLPNRLCDYLYGLAENFNAFFRDCRVEGTPEEKSRLLLCELFATTMKLGLDLLGVETVEKM
ncbi:MAG: arginine--tRNA ligase [Parachlamydiales bacterium]|jgi:arginyl-tRNA synthetase